MSALLLMACSDGAPEAAAPSGNAAQIASRNATEALPVATAARFVKLQALSERSGLQWASVAELNLIDSTGANVDRKTWQITADSAEANDPPGSAIDGNPSTHWHTQWQGDVPAMPHELVVDLGASIRISGFRYLPRQDRSLNGVIAKYRFYVSADGKEWGTPVSAGDFTALGAANAEKTVLFARQTANHAPVAKAVPLQNAMLGESVSMQVSANDEDGDPLTFSSTGLPPGLSIAATTGLVSGTPIAVGEYKVGVDVRDSKGASVVVAFGWTVRPPAAIALQSPGEVRFVKLEALSEIRGREWSSIAEFNVVGADGKSLSRDGWSASADSAAANDKPANAIDGNASTHWHSQWDGVVPLPPHSLIVDMGHGATVRGFRYLPRQDRIDNGGIARFRFYTSVDGVTWGAPVAEGDFSKMGRAGEEKTVMLR